MGHDSDEIGDAGEGLFMRLARHWRAKFVHTSRASGTDGYLHWSNMAGTRLWIQVKTIEKRNRKTNALNIRIKAQHLRDWAYYRPLLVLCVLDENRAWWIDTDKVWWPWGTRKGKVFRMPLSNPVDASTRDAVRKIASSRPCYRPPHVLPAKQPRMSFSPDKAYEILEDAYKGMTAPSMSILDRDITAQAIARMIHCNLRSLSGAISADKFLSLVIFRLLAPEQGGRSLTLGTLASLLYPSHHLPFGSEFESHLMVAIERAITTHRFIIPQFGLLTGAFLFERFGRSQVSDLLRDLNLQVIDCPQNQAVKDVAKKLVPWLDGITADGQKVPVASLFSHNWLTRLIIRQLRQNADVYTNFDEAEAAAMRSFGDLRQVSPHDLELTDQYIRRKASELLDKWAHY